MPTTLFPDRQVLSRLFRTLFLETLSPPTTPAACGSSASMRSSPTRLHSLLIWRHCASIDWVVYAKQPFGGPRQVLRYLSRYTHRVAISNRRLVALDENDVTFKWKDYRDRRRQRS